jgi:2OG-Fe(II) oxygenase superfamily
MIMLDYSARLARHGEPFVHFVGDGVLSPPALSALRGASPDLALFKRVVSQGPEVRREYRFSVLSIVEESRLVLDEHQLPSCWRALVADLSSKAFVSWIGDQTELDVSACRASLGLFVHRGDDFQGLTTGKLGKTLGVSLYINDRDTWPADRGGAFELRERDGRAPCAEVMPHAGRCLAFTPTPHSWHRTQPITGGSELQRMFLTMQYFPRAGADVGA